MKVWDITQPTNEWGKYYAKMEWQRIMWEQLWQPITYIPVSHIEAAQNGRPECLDGIIETCTKKMLTNESISVKKSQESIKKVLGRKLAGLMDVKKKNGLSNERTVISTTRSSAVNTSSNISETQEDMAKKKPISIKTDTGLLDTQKLRLGSQNTDSLWSNKSIANSLKERASTILTASETITDQKTWNYGSEQSDTDNEPKTSYAISAVQPTQSKPPQAILDVEADSDTTCEWNGDCEDSAYPELCAPCLESAIDNKIQLEEDNYRSRYED